MTRTFQYIKCEGSALYKYPAHCRNVKFQYIKCEGSAKRVILKESTKNYFNTSNVKVPPACILLALGRLSRFQYIKCEGSAWYILDARKTRKYFNTSNVKVPQAENNPY